MTSTPAMVQDGYRLVAWLFLRALALVYLAAFTSLAVQIDALAGSAGVYPITEQLARARDLYAGGWLDLGPVFSYPSLFWLWPSDLALRLVAWGGVGLACLLLVGRPRGGRRLGRNGWERALLIGLWLAYLSLFHAGQLFLNFQWDYLLLETGFLAILLPGGTRWVVWLFRLLLFKLRFLSGLAKLLSGDESWRGFTALQHYFETQPLPHAGAWFAHQLPDWLLRAGTAGTLFVELVVPFFFLLPRRWRLAAAALTILWQVLIIATSNHNFFNLLTIVLCLFLLDDRALGRLLPAGLARRLTDASPLAARPGRGPRIATALVAAMVVPASLVAALEMVSGPVGLASRLYDRLEPLRVANRYHVFPTIETERVAVQVEASRDGARWVALDFRHAPGVATAMPGFLVPHQPRIDWLLWFVPMHPHFLDWFERWLTRLLEGAPAVTATLARPPFAEGPPRLLRVSVARYRFATPAERARDGVWWVVEPLGPFHPLPLLKADGAG